MKEKLISQFQEKPIIAAELEALEEELAEITTAMNDLQEKRWIDTGAGVQLDGIGEIVGKDRTLFNVLVLPFFGFRDQPDTLTFGEGRFRDSGENWLASTELSDALYRLILWAKVLKNTSKCNVNDTIRALKYIFNCHEAIVEDVGNAKIKIGIGRKLTASDLMIFQAFNLMIRAGGVGIELAESYHAGYYFGFRDQRNAQGFEIGIFADLVDLYNTPKSETYYFGFSDQKNVRTFGEGIFREE